MKITMNDDKRHNKISIITDNEYLKLGLFSLLDDLDPKIIVNKAILLM